MDPDQYQRAREHFHRLQAMPPAERAAALHDLLSQEPDVGATVRDLIDADAPSSKGDDLFEQAIHAGVADRARDLAEPTELAKDQRIGSFRIISLLGRGGFGDVYLAEQTSPRRSVAMKVVKAGMDSRAVLRRFDQERQVLASLNHPNIARLYESGYAPAELGSRPYFAMEYVDGPPLHRYCQRESLGIRERLRLFIEVCRAVQHAHTKGVMHRDLKPSNILVSCEDDGATPKVIDFGIAKALDHRLHPGTMHTAEGQLIGTLAYMSPEQAAGGDVDTKTDVYALGVVLYELLTGTLPFSAESLADVPPTEAQRIICETEPQKPSTRISRVAGAQTKQSRDRVADARTLRNELDWIVLRCLEKDPRRRYASPDALARDIERYTSGDLIEARPPSTVYKWRRLALRHRGPVAIASLVLLSLLGSIVALLVIINIQANEARTRVERDEYQAKASELETANARLEVADRESRRVNRQLSQANHQLRLTTDQLQAKSQDLEERSAQLQAALETQSRLADQERRAKEDAQRAREQLAIANAELDASLDQTQEARDRAEAALIQAEENARLAAAEAQRADAEAANFKRLFDEAERSVKVITRGNRIPTDVLEQVAQALGSEGLLQAQIYERLAQRAVADAKPARAIDLQQRAMAAYTGSLGSDETQTLNAHLELAGILQRAGRLAQAADQLDLLAAAAERSLGTDDALRTRIDLARGFTSFYRGEHRRALALLDGAVADLEQRYGEYDPRTLSAVRRRAMVHAAIGDSPSAEADYRRVLTLNASTTDQGREDLTIAANNLAVLLRQSDRDSEAEAVLGRAVWTARGVWGADNWRTAMVEAQHASALAALGRFDRAEPKLLDAYGILEATLGSTHTETRAVARELLHLYDAWDAAEGTTDHAQDAKKWQRVLNVP
ncbi:MAG: protein kinase [Phycisphaerales bacterium JB060]